MTTIATFCIVFFLPICILAQEDTLEQEKESLSILNKLDLMRFPAKAFSFSLQIFEYEKQECKSEANLRIFARSSEESINRALVCWVGPLVDQGKVMLMDSTVFWLYTPGTKNAIRISANQKLVGLVTCFDMASLRLAKDYKVIFKILENYGTIPCYRFILQSKSKELPYGGLELLVNQKTYRILFCKYYARDGRLLKTAHYKEPESTTYEAGEILVVDGEDVNLTTKLYYSNVGWEEKPIYMYRKESLPQFNEDNAPK